jgi:hypothetical protein
MRSGQRIGPEPVDTPWDQPVDLTVTARDAQGNVPGTFETVMPDERSYIGLEDSCLGIPSPRTKCPVWLRPEAIPRVSVISTTAALNP